MTSNLKIVGTYPPTIQQRAIISMLTSGSEDGSSFELFRADSRQVEKNRDYWALPALGFLWHNFKWRLALVFASMVAFIVLLRKALANRAEETVGS